jgi:hypothetical protein
MCWCACAVSVCLYCDTEPLEQVRNLSSGHIYPLLFVWNKRNDVFLNRNFRFCATESEGEKVREYYLFFGLRWQLFTSCVNGLKITDIRKLVLFFYADAATFGTQTSECSAPL